MPSFPTKLFFLILDIALAMFALAFSILVTENFNIESTIALFGLSVLIFLGIKIGAFLFFRTYLLIVRFIGFEDYRRSSYAVAASSLVFSVAQLGFANFINPILSVNVLLLDFLLLLALMIFSRVILKMLVDRFRIKEKSNLNTIVFGAGDLGAMVQQIMLHNTTHDYKIVGFVDDNPRAHRKYLNGVKVYDPRKNFDQLVESLDVKVAIIAINNLPEERRVEFINACLEHRIKVMKVPTAESWIGNQLNLSQLQDIKFEDLLNRPPIKLDEQSVNDSVNDKVVVVTGCAGSIGSEIVRQLLKHKPKLVIGIDQAETPLAHIHLSLKKDVEAGRFKSIIGDVKEYGKLEKIFETYGPDYVFHAAAYKHVPVMERFPEEAIKANVLGTKNLADLATKFGVKKFVMISTDKVVNPTNVMGTSKRIAEIYVQSLNAHPENKTQFITTRFGNVLGSNGSVIPIFKRQIETKKPVTVTHPEVTRYFMTIPEACQLVLEAGAMGNGGEIFVFNMGEPVKIVDLARKMILMAGMVPNQDIDIIFTGLRPGEKLYEELLDGQEGTIPTHHPKIKKATVREYQFEVVGSKIQTLIDGAVAGEIANNLVRQMKDLVPEFKSKNSEFEALDK